MNKKNVPPTLSDVAILAGVSKAVASRALSGKNRPISADKKARVCQAAKSLGYVANPFAQSLANNETNLIAIVVNHISDVSDLTLFDFLIQGIQSIGKQALFIRLKSSHDIEQLEKNSFVQRVDAVLIFSDLIDPELAASLFYTNIIIMLNGKSQEQGYSVKINEELGIKNTIEHANSIGIKRAILIAGRQSSMNENQRVLHYLTHFNRHNIILESSVFCDYSYDKALLYLTSGETINNHDLGIFCTSDSMAMAAVDYCKASELSHYSQRIFGFDNTDFSRRGSYQFSTIGFSKQQFVQSIISMIKQAQSSPTDNLLIGIKHNEKWLTSTANHLIIETQFYLNTHLD